MMRGNNQGGGVGHGQRTKDRCCCSAYVCGTTEDILKAGHVDGPHVRISSGDGYGRSSTAHPAVPIPGSQQANEIKQ
eukprot:19626-Eustigmatos_ZCMA.PRE.1